MLSMRGKSDVWHFKDTFWMVCLMPLFCGLSYSCGNAEYDNNGECCPMCTPGSRVYKHCTEYTSTSCVPCTQRTYMDVANGLPRCFLCSVCDPGLGLKTDRECTPSSNTVCGPLNQHYCTKADNKGCTFAKKHTICRPGQFIKRNGTTSTNTECRECPEKTFSNESSSAFCKPHTDCQPLGLMEIAPGTNTSDSKCGENNIPVSIVAVSVGPAIIIILVISATIFIFIFKRRKIKERKDRTKQSFNEGRRMLDMLEIESPEPERRNMISLPQEEVLQEGQEPIPACKQEAGIHPGQDPNPLQDTHDIHSPTYSFRQFNIISMFFHWGRKPKYPEGNKKNQL